MYQDRIRKNHCPDSLMESNSLFSYVAYLALSLIGVLSLNDGSKWSGLINYCI